LEFNLYTFGYQFAPRYRDLHKKMDGLVGFHHPSHYAGHLIKPSRKIHSYVNSGKFRVKTEAEQQIWNECSRLIANAIIYYNTLLLSRVYEQKLAADDQEAIKILRGTSPVGWRDVNLIGNFDFAARTSHAY
jgi:hypothetical protein